MAWIYKKTNDNKHRFALGEVDKNPGKLLFCFGINPSTATPTSLDPTVKHIKEISQAHGYNSWVMLNVCSQRATDPNKMDDEQKEILHSKNLKIISRLLKQHSDNSDILFAYGDLINKKPYLEKNLCEIINIIKKTNYSGKCYCLGKTKSGNPRHPLYQKTNTAFVTFSLDGHTYSEIFYLEDNKCAIREYAENGDLILETFGVCKSK